MARGDKYSKANALSKLFEEMLRRNSGDKAKAAGSMDSELGPEWRTEIVIDDEVGPEFIEPAILEIEVAEPDEKNLEKDEMFKKARKFAETFVMPGDDLEFDPGDEAVQEKEDEEEPCISDLLRDLADQLDKKKKK